MGTPSHMAPKQASGKTVDVGPGTDIYALGAILYATLTAHPPFQGTTVLETRLQSSNSSLEISLANVAAIRPPGQMLRVGS
jgi:serine/threonine protein kinase